MLRWLVRRDTEASATLLGGWLNKLDDVIAVVVGVQHGIVTGIFVLLALHSLKCVIGYVDLKHVKATAFRNHYISEKAPNNVRVLKRASSSN